MRLYVEQLIDITDELKSYFNLCKKKDKNYSNLIFLVKIKPKSN